MVFARSKLTMEDNCFEEEPGSVEMKFVGQNVTKIYKKTYRRPSTTGASPTGATSSASPGGCTRTWTYSVIFT
jgi:hypothetical protein